MRLAVTLLQQTKRFEGLLALDHARRAALSRTGADTLSSAWPELSR